MKGNEFTGINQSGSSILRSMIVVVVTPIPGVLQTPEVVLPLEAAPEVGWRLQDLKGEFDKAESAWKGGNDAIRYSSTGEMLFGRRDRRDRVSSSYISGSQRKVYRYLPSWSEVPGRCSWSKSRNLERVRSGLDVTNKQGVSSHPLNRGIKTTKARAGDERIGYSPSRSLVLFVVLV